MYLNCHTGYSFQYGTLSIAALFEEARRCGIHQLALTEINNTASYIELLRLVEENKAQANGLTSFGKIPHHLQVIVGMELRNDNDLCFLALARNNRGFETINRFFAQIQATETKKIPKRAPEWSDVFVVYPFGRLHPEELRENEFLGVAASHLAAYARYQPRQLWAHKFVLWHPVTFLPPQRVIDASQKSKWVYRDFNAHRLLRSIANNVLLSKLPVHLQAQPDEYMLSEYELAQKYADFPELLVNAKSLLNACSFHYQMGKDKNKTTLFGSSEKDILYLRAETEKGYCWRYGTDQAVWNSHIEKELRIIQQKGFVSYYLIAYDLICFARQQGYDYVGRGSGANSTVAYCLGITNVDPIELDLYFERFLNEERVSPPDFDIDFSWDNRDAIYQYLFERYGPEHVCLLGTHVSYQPKSILRELGKVFGLPKEEIDELVEQRHQRNHRDHITEKIQAYAQYILDKELPAHLSIHAGGVLITEKPIYQYTATHVPPKGLPVSHFDMHGAEDFGIHKLDILSQRGLGHIKETVLHVKRNRDIEVDVYQFKQFKQDEKIKDLMRKGHTMGCFYVESPAMRMLLGKLRCEDYLTLVAASSIIRPGVASSGMMKAYIERFHAVRNGRTYDSIHPRMDQLMADTYGVMVYQEDVIKVAHHFAGLTLTEADVLRRGMSGKYRSREEFQRVRDQFFSNCHQKGYEPRVTKRVWEEIESFAGYSFAKGHSASYAVESYQSLFLKAHFPLEFMVGVINNFGGFYQTEFYFHEARMQGAAIEAPCVNHSEHLTRIEGQTIYVGFIHVKSLEEKVATRVAPERQKNGPYQSLHHFLDRMPGIGLEQVRLLIRLGAFRYTGQTKQELLWQTMLYFSQPQKHQTLAQKLFNTDPKNYPLPPLERGTLDDAFDEMELLGFPLCAPFLLVDTHDLGDTRARELPGKKGSGVHLAGYLVTKKDTRTRGGQMMHFGTFYDAEGYVFDTVHFPDVAFKYPFRGRGFYRIKGKVVEDFGVFMIEVSCMEKLPMKAQKQLL
ncbi:MAG: DNA polymerase III subunit alpha [Bacteroidota bacterium]